MIPTLSPARTALAVSLLSAGPLVAASYAPLDFSNNSGLGTLFTTGTSFTNVDGNGTSLTMVGMVADGVVESVTLPNDNVLLISSTKQGPSDVAYQITITLSSPITGLGFASLDVTNQETLQLDLTPNGAGNWTGNIVQLNSWGTYSGLGTPIVNGIGPNGGEPVSSITVADVPISAFTYSYTHSSGNSLDESFSLVIVPEPAAPVLVCLAGTLLLVRRNRTSATVPQGC